MLHLPNTGRSGLGLLDELDSVANSQDRVSCVVWDLDAEFFFESHDQFNGIERISAQIVNEACAFNNFVGVDAQMINYNFLYAFCDIAHVGFLDLYFEGNALRHPALLEALMRRSNPALLANPFNPVQARHRRAKSQRLPVSPGRLFTVLARLTRFQPVEKPENALSTTYDRQFRRKPAWRVLRRPTPNKVQKQRRNRFKTPFRWRQIIAMPPLTCKVWPVM
ncbi:Acyl carrier protein (modular protein) [Agrobacterium fabacearum CFBP 5771]|nr:Acyl carrier protein (modular protein) [Agrobacterium fabacearum S56]CUW87913.1 Acyl carrier protein (modular protein) [Agrobacterium fabacearum TT111]CVI16111.1 Acyl carrier protein (modular protein) [Agrobacterium fabacearum CFBP 5771]